MLVNTTFTLFKVTFDVIKGKLLALIEAHTLRRMKANNNFGKTKFGPMIGQSYKRFFLNIYNSHLSLPLKLQLIQWPAPSSQKSLHQIASGRLPWFTKSGAMFRTGTLTAWKLTAAVNRDQNQLPHCLENIYDKHRVSHLWKPQKSSPPLTPQF